MRLLLLVAIFAFVQICSARPKDLSPKNSSSPFVNLNQTYFNDQEKEYILLDFRERFPDVKRSDVQWFLMLYDKFQPNASEKDKIEGVANLFSVAWDIPFWKVNRTFFHTAQDSSAKTMRKIKRLLTMELTPAKLEPALRILKGLDPNATKAEDKASDVELTVSLLHNTLDVSKYDACRKMFDDERAINCERYKPRSRFASLDAPKPHLRTHTPLLALTPSRRRKSNLHVSPPIKAKAHTQPRPKVKAKAKVKPAAKSRSRGH